MVTQSMVLMEPAIVSDLLMRRAIFSRTPGKESGSVGDLRNWSDTSVAKNELRLCRRQGHDEARLLRLDNVDERNSGPPPRNGIIRS